MNISGESFDYGRMVLHDGIPPLQQHTLTTKAYSFGRQPEALHWNCGQLAVALRLLCDSEPLWQCLTGLVPYI